MNCHHVLETISNWIMYYIFGSLKCSCLHYNIFVVFCIYVCCVLWFACIIFIQHIIFVVCNMHVIYNQVNVLALFDNCHIVSNCPVHFGHSPLNSYFYIYGYRTLNAYYYDTILLFPLPSLLIMHERVDRHQQISKLNVICVFKDIVK